MWCKVVPMILVVQVWEKFRSWRSLLPEVDYYIQHILYDVPSEQWYSVDSFLLLKYDENATSSQLKQSSFEFFFFSRDILFNIALLPIPLIRLPLCLDLRPKLKNWAKCMTTRSSLYQSFNSMRNVFAAACKGENEIISKKRGILIWSDHSPRGGSAGNYRKYLLTLESCTLRLLYQH